MDLYFIGLLIVAAILSLRGEEDPARKRMFIIIYLVLIVVAFSYHAGHTIGKFIYGVMN